MGTLDRQEGLNYYGKQQGICKCQGQCNIDITCGKCNREIVVIVDEERVMVLENRRTTGKNERAGQVRISVQKKKNPQKTDQLKKAASY